jgi:hypothetical protein
MYIVFENVGDDVQYYNGTLTSDADALARLLVRAGLDPNQRSPFGYVGSAGKIRLPFGEAVRIAHAFCASEPAPVLVAIESTEGEWAQQARTPGDAYMVGLLNEYRASWALLRQWMGQDAAVAQREATIERLERLVWDAIYALQKAGLDGEAGRLRRAISKH